MKMLPPNRAGRPTAMTAVDASIASSREHDAELLARIVELFVASGYYRARFAGVSDFDKVLGALSWGVRSCRSELDFGDGDVDSVMHDVEAKMGAKIALCEALEKALSKMGCPFALRAHQVRGLDYEALFPVTQWLVKRVIATREEFGDSTRAYSRFMYARAHGRLRLDGDGTAEAVRRRAESGRALRDAYGPKRVFRRAKGTEPPRANASRWAKSVMMEYGHKLAGLEAFASAATAVLAASRWKRKTKASKAAGTLRAPTAKGSAGGGAAEGGMSALIAKVGALGVAENNDDVKDDFDDEEAVSELNALRDLESTLAVDDGSSTLSNAVARAILGSSGKEVLAAAEKFGGDIEFGGTVGKMLAVERKIVAMERKLAAETALVDEARERAKTAQTEVASALEELDKVVSYNDKCSDETQKLKDAVSDPKQREAMERIMELIQRASQTKMDEKAFKSECKKRMAELKEEIENGGEHTLTSEERAQIEEVEATYQREKEKYESERLMLNKRTRAVALLSRKLEDIPTRPELIQYERRFEELYETVQSKLKETRKYFAQYNVLADTKKYLVKEISLLNSLQSQVHAAVETVSGKSSLVTALASIQDGVQANIKLVEAKLANEQNALEDVRDSYDEAVRRHRRYLALVKELRDACAEEAELRSRISNP